MFTKIIQPSEQLKPFIKHYFVLETDYSFEFSPKQRVYPYGNVILVFHYGNPSMFQKRDGVPEIEPLTVICGQQTSYYDLSLSGKTGMVFVVFQPCGAGMFFNIPVNELINQNLAFECIMNKEAIELEDKILNSRYLKDKIGIIEDFLIKKLKQNKQDPKPLISAYYKIVECNGLITVRQLAEISCLSIKQFERRFSALVGLMPKQYLRITRFQNIIQKRSNKAFNNYTSLAFECGYFDQPHFISDFKAYTGLSPKEFFEKKV